MISAIDGLSRLGCLFPGSANFMLDRPGIRKGLARMLGLTEKRPFPKYAKERFDDWFKKRSNPNRTNNEPVFLWDDTFTRYYDPHIGRAAVQVLEMAGFHVQLVQGRECCGRPAFSQGNLDHARFCGERNLKLVEECFGNHPEAPLLFLEPSCFSMFAEDYRELGIPKASDLAEKCLLFEDFIHRMLQNDPERLPFQGSDVKVAIHAHCHAKTLTRTETLPQLAERVPGCEATLLDTGCCGMAGAFGSLEEHYELSRKVAQPLVELIQDRPAGSKLVASGVSCRHQIEHLTVAKPLHMAEFLSQHLMERRLGQ
jgi:Fe-S oxidoreductase